MTERTKQLYTCELVEYRDNWCRDITATGPSAAAELYAEMLCDADPEIADALELEPPELVRVRYSGQERLYEVRRYSRPTYAATIYEGRD